MTELLSPQQAWDEIGRGEAALVDLRPPSDFASGYPKNALNLPYSSRSFAERLALMLPPGKAVVLIAHDDALTQATLAQLDGSAFSLRGIVRGGVQAWQEAGLPVETLPEMSLPDMLSAVEAGETVVLDVREPVEWETGHVPDAILIAMGAVRQNLDRIPRGKRIAVICESGVRSCTVASLLRIEGFADVANVVEGTRGYRQSGLLLQYWSGAASAEG